MAYGLDFEEIYYTNHDRVDLGVLETYEIDVDLADEKDFSISSPEPVIPVHGFWYIQDTEYGGIVDAFNTDSSEESVEYEGRTFRGILDSHFVDVVGKEKTIPENMTADVDQEGAGAPVQATISDCFRELVASFGDLFEVDDPDVNETVDTRVMNYTIKAGTTVYEALVGCARSIDFTFVLAYKKDKKIHITPILIQDYTDYLKGSRYEGFSFKTEIETGVTNHVIMKSIDEESGDIFNIHFFADKNSGMQPYAIVDAPIKDSQYILDNRNQVLFGIDEIAEYQEENASVIENYEMLEECPADWETNFGSYFMHEFDESGEESFVGYEAVGEEVYTAVTSRPSDWSTNYSAYYIRSYDEEAQEYVYNPVSAESVLVKTNPRQITKKPYDWSSNYNEYYYKYQTGTGIDYQQYSAVQKNKYVRMTAKPSDWDTNFSSYYRKVYEKKEGSKTKLIDTVDHAGAKYVACAADDDKKNGTIPSFSKRAHYRNDPYEIPPTFNKNNCWRLHRVSQAPTFDPVGNRYYSMKMEYHAPTFVVGEGYQKVLDHYAGMVESALDIFEDAKNRGSQTMELDEFVVNVGDIVGGTDEFTGTNVVGNITNIEAHIENGLIDVKYAITVEDYETNLITEG